MMDLEFLLEEDLFDDIFLESFGGIRINKYKLIDENYIKELIKEIENLPSDSEREKYYQIAINDIDHFINTAKNVDHRYSRLPEYTKASMDREMKIYENNKKLLLKNMNKYNNSNYQNGYIRIGKAYWFALAANRIKSDKDYEFIQNLIKRWSKKNYNDFSKVTFEDSIEEIAFAKYDMSKMMKFLDNNKGDANYVVDDIDNSSMLRVLKGKTLTQVIYNNSAYIVYCHEDNCCYVFSAKYQDGIDKVSLSQVINASNVAYKDLQKMIKEYK